MSIDWNIFTGFYKKSVPERVHIVEKVCNLTREDVDKLAGGSLAPELADRMVENVIGTFEYPLGIATNFRVNGRDFLVPMVIEESSVIAAASKAAKITLTTGGFQAEAPRSLTIGQIQIINIPDLPQAKIGLEKSKLHLLELANEVDPVLVGLGGGAVDFSVKQIEGQMGSMLVMELLVDSKDAMGANTVNSMLEALSGKIEALTGGQTCLRILSNLAIHRIARAQAIFPASEIGGQEAVDRVLWAFDFAANDPFRAATHNKGILNGIIAVAQATGNDTRAIEAGAHAYAGMGEGYHPLTKFSKTVNGDLKGEISIPLTVGRVGGITGIHPTAVVAWKILGVDSIALFYEILAAVGLAQNFAALLALATVGIQKGHMKLHASNLAIMAGASGPEIERVVSRLVKESRVNLDRAKHILEDIRKNDA